MSSTRPGPPQSPPTRPLNVNEISKHLFAIESRWNGVATPEDEDAQSETTQTTSTLDGDGMDTPRASECQDDDEEDEMVSKVIANLQAKIEAVKRHKKVAAEVVTLRKLLAEKEKDLAECERIMTLELGQVSG
ncbi:uncharacterized protein H6S33_012102 [Morchella sextelata]|uniref:uncharacterized protein n=1 Tax=Morchella sextelata TaxID=1174677 RepID=UPI001D046AE4|nr:uncharacterized protein H6S33_012102 [Morchella sextelata]KAH0610575.1 hypothetical protein H6S33_012102 [Morchella sextelata]